VCGIAGFSGFKGDSASIIARMVGSLVHRGPDDEGVLVAGSAAVGMRRLSIIDVAHGKQPIATQDGNLSVVFNGEIYNHADIRRELEALGCVFQTQSDTEVVLQGYKIWGADCLSRLRGMFAFAIYDRRDESLFIARDRIGIKPLYYASLNGQLIFASEIKSLLQHPDLPREVNPAAVDEYLSLRYVCPVLRLYSTTLKNSLQHISWCGAKAEAISSVTGLRIIAPHGTVASRKRRKLSTMLSMRPPAFTCSVNAR
jgi:asparagine synthase (glutamine-hydrolysing)